MPTQGAPIRSSNIAHTQAYKLHPERGPYLDIKVTPPSPRGVDGRVLVEVYNRTKLKLATVKFDITLQNSGGFSIGAVIEASSLNPNMSGAQWVKIPKIGGQFPAVSVAVVDGLRSITVDAREEPIKGFVTLITR
jgi:hypothetical protein